jgi:uncharacterized membrane protein YjjB (DUF3815 family)
MADRLGLRLCGLCGHAFRTSMMHFGLPIGTATLIGSLATGGAAHFFANGYRMPAATFAFPGVLPMFPGTYAFRAVIGLLELMKAGERTPITVQAETLSLVVTTILLMIVIAVGLAIPLAMPTNSRHSRNPSPVEMQPVHVNPGKKGASK